MKDLHDYLFEKLQLAEKRVCELETELANGRTLRAQDVAFDYILKNKEPQYRDLTDEPSQPGDEYYDYYGQQWCPIENIQNTLVEFCLQRRRPINRA